MTSNKQTNKRGFALIATIVIMSLLLLVALAFLGISTTEARTVRVDDAEAKARANAKLALMIAIGELQEAMGPDQRISATSAIFAPDGKGLKAKEKDFDPIGVESGFSEPYLLGVWNAWDKWLHHSEISDTYTEGRVSHFRRYLVSHPDKSELYGTKGLDLAKNGFGGIETVELYKEMNGSSSPFQKRVVAPYVGMEDGGYAWHIGGQNMKANLALSAKGSKPDALATASAELSGRNYHGLSDGLHAALKGYPSDDDSLSKVISLSSAELTQNDAKAYIRNHKHDYTDFSQSLLINVRNGGFKKDLNTLLELQKLPYEYDGRHASNPEADRPVRIHPTDREVGSPRFPAPDGKPNLSSWYKLYQYYQLYRGSQSSLDEIWQDQCNMPGSNLVKGLSTHSNIPFVNFNWHLANMNQRGYGRSAIVARNLVEMGIKKEGSGDSTRYFLMMNPTITMWNPYNVSIVTPKTWTEIKMGGFEMKVYKDGVLLQDWTHMGALNSNVFTMPGRGRGTETTTLKPGEALIYSTIPNVHTAGGNRWVELYPGYEPFTDGGGVKRDLSLAIPSLRGSGNFEIAIRVTDQHKTHANNHQFYWTTRNEYNRAQQRFNEMAANPIEPDKPIEIIRDRGGERLRLSTTSTTKRFCNFGFSLKLGERLNKETDEFYSDRDYRGKNFIFSKAWTNRSMYGQPSDRMKAISQYEMFFDRVTGNGGNTDIEPGTNRGYIMSSHYKQGEEYDGQLFAPLAEIPVSPAYSLASLQGFALEQGFGAWAGGFHLWEQNTNHSIGIGSSYASSLIPADKVYNRLDDAPSGGGFAQGQMMHITDSYDHTFLNNDALFDAWFTSTLTPQDTQAFTEKRDISDVYDDFVRGEKALPNHYMMFVGDREDVKGDLIDGKFPSEQAHKEIAQYLRVRGAFNVNSVSVEAWKALFHGLRQDGLRYMDVTSGEVQTTEFSEPKVVISRLSLPCSAGEASASDGANDPNAWRGVRYLTDEQIEKLAKECVRQVKLRGPFLNMADFVNRRLDNSNEDFSICGALQAAIDWDEFNGNTPSYSDAKSINGRFKRGDDMVTNTQPDSWKAGPDLAFKKAYEGSRWTGIPGYVTQADLLKRLGNSLVVRDDTFVIRAYGDAKDDTGKVVARAYCEAVVSRGIDFTDSTQSSSTEVSSLNETNKKFGRKFQIKSFKWLSSNEL